MIIKYFRVYSTKKIQEIFPNLTDVNTIHYSEDCGIYGGWNPDMAKMTNQIWPITRDYSENPNTPYVQIGSHGYYFDIRLGSILIVDTKKEDNCYFLESVKNRLMITKNKSEFIVGGIVNLPPPPLRKNLIRSVLNKKIE